MKNNCAVCKSNKKCEYHTLKAALDLIKKQVGKRCPDYAMGCYNCAVWRMIDDLADFIKLINEK